MRKIVLLLIRFYQMTLSPLMGSSCRFYPTCSHYTYQAIETHGVLRGGWLGTKRVFSCNPFNPGGFDPVPGLPHTHDEVDIDATETDALHQERGE
jgi:putative membrane protein insertion efficiency factor